MEQNCEGFKCLMNRHGKAIAIGAGIAGSLIGGALLLPEAVGYLGLLELLQLTAGEGVALAGVETVLTSI